MYYVHAKIEHFRLNIEWIIDENICWIVFLAWLQMRMDRRSDSQYIYKYSVLYSMNVNNKQIITLLAPQSISTGTGTANQMQTIKRNDVQVKIEDLGINPNTCSASHIQIAWEFYFPSRHICKCVFFPRFIDWMEMNECVLNWGSVLLSSWVYRFRIHKKFLFPWNASETKIYFFSEFIDFYSQQFMPERSPQRTILRTVNCLKHSFFQVSIRTNLWNLKKAVINSCLNCNPDSQWKHINHHVSVRHITKMIQ